MRSSILASALATGLLFLSTAHASSITARAPALKCGTPQFTSSLFQITEATGVRRNASFQTAKDYLGRTMLSTSVNGVAAPASAKFEFVPCNSTVLRHDAAQMGANGRSFGQIRPVGQPTRDLTLSYTKKNTTARAFVNAPCTTVDSVSTLASQWFGAFYYTYPTPGIGNRFVVQLVGDTNLNTTGYWTYNNVASGNARLFEASWDQTGSASIPYNLYMSQTFTSG